MYELFKISRQKNEPPVESVQLVTMPQEGHLYNSQPCLMVFPSSIIPFCAIVFEALDTEIGCKNLKEK